MNPTRPVAWLAAGGFLAAVLGGVCLGASAQQTRANAEKDPVLKAIDGLPCYPDLDAAQAAAKKETGAGIDLVDVFRAPEHVPAIVEDVIRLEIPYLWLQDGVMHEGAVARARAEGVKCIQDDCIFREHAARPELHGKH